MKKFCLLMLLTILLSGLGVSSASAKMTETLNITDKAIEAREALINAEAPEGDEMLFGYGSGAGLFYFGDFFITSLYEDQGDEMCMLFRTDATKTDEVHIITNQRYKYVIVNERNNLVGMFANVKREYDEPNNGFHVVELEHYYADIEDLAGVLDFTVPIEQHQVISFPLNVAEYDTYADLMGNLDKSYLLVFEANAIDLSGLKYKIPFNKLLNHYDENVLYGMPYPVKDESEALYPIEGEFGYVDAIFENIVYDANQEPTGFIATVSYDILNDFSVFPGTGATLESIEVFTSDNFLCFSERFRYDDANAYRGTFDIVVDEVADDDYTFVFKTNTGLEEKRVITVSGVDFTEATKELLTVTVSKFPESAVKGENVDLEFTTNKPSYGYFEENSIFDGVASAFLATVTENGTYVYKFVSEDKTETAEGTVVVNFFKDAEPIESEIEDTDFTADAEESEPTNEITETVTQTPVVGEIVEGADSTVDSTEVVEKSEPTNTVTQTPVVGEIVGDISGELENVDKDSEAQQHAGVEETNLTWLWVLLGIVSVVAVIIALCLVITKKNKKASN